MKVLLIAPYSGLAESAKQVQTKQDIQMDIEVGNLELGVEIAKEREDNYDVIISRGGTAQLIQKEVSIPVAHINITGYDMLRVLKLVRDFHEKFALVGFSNITEGAVALCDILDFDVDITTINNRQEVYEELLYLKENDYHIILGDVVTVQTAQKLGLKGILIASGQEALIDALAEAERLYDNYLKVKAHFTSIEKLYHSIPMPLAIYHTHQKIILKNVDNDIFAQLLQSPECKTALNHISQTDREQVIEINLNNVSYYVKMIPLTQETIGLIILHFFQKNAYPFLKLIHGVEDQQLIGESKHISNIKTSIDRLAMTKKTVTLIGEIGTGKKLIANNIHVKMSEDTTMLYYLDLHMLGNSLAAFTSFVKEVGSTLQGTIVIENIHLLSRKIEQSFIHFVKTIKMRVKLITITTHNPYEFMENNIISDELVKLLSEETVHIPALRDRKDDIQALVHYYVMQMYTTTGVKTIGIKEDALTLLSEYTWPYNIYELQQMVKELSLVSKGHYICKDDVQDFLLQSNKHNEPYRSIPLKGTLKEMEANIIHQVLAEENQNQTKAAARLGINRTTLWRKINE